MPSTVIVKMHICSKTHRITVSMRDDGDMDVSIVSDCKNVQEYAKRLTVITMGDITERRDSKVNDPDIAGCLSATCLSPCGVLNAAWIEVGMLSQNMCRKVHHNEIILDEFDSGQ